MMNPDSIRGRLEQVHIEDRISDKCALGRLGIEKIFVTNGVDHVGKDCIVKFDLWPKQAERGIISNFITSEVPQGFSGIASNQYVLVGNWQKRTEKKSCFPYLEEINRYFDPGDMQEVFYFRDGVSYKSGGLAYIDKFSRFSRHETISAVIRKYLPDPDVFTRVIIAEEHKLTNVVNIINKFGLVPILMEPLR